MNQHDVALFDEQPFHVSGTSDFAEDTEWVKRSPKAAPARPARRGSAAAAGAVTAKTAKPRAAASSAKAAVPTRPVSVPRSAAAIGRTIPPPDDLDASLEPAPRREERPRAERRGSHAAELFRPTPRPSRPRVERPRRSALPGAAVTLIGAAAAGLTLSVVGSSLLAGGVIAVALLGVPTVAPQAPPVAEAAAAVAQNPAVTARPRAAGEPRPATVAAAPRAATGAPRAASLPPTVDAPEAPAAAPARASRPSTAPVAAAAAPPAAPLAADDWLGETVSGVAGRVAALVAGEPQGLEPVATRVAPGTSEPAGFTDPLVPPARAGAADDATLQLLAELEADRRAPAVVAGTAAAPVAESGRPAVAPSVAMRATDVADAPAPTGGWMDTVAAVTAEVASRVTGQTVTVTRAVAPGTPEAPAATVVAVAKPTGGALADDDLGVGSLAVAPRDGWQTAAAADDPAMQLLAELDRPAPARPAGTAGAPAAEAGGPARAVAAPTSALPAAPASAPVVAMRASEVAGGGGEPGWMDTVLETAASVASIVSGEAPLAPTGVADEGVRVAPGTGGAAAAPVDLLADDDLGVGALGPAPRDGWQTAAAADDPAMQLLAELDAPAGARPAGTAAAPRGEAGGPALAVDDDLSALTAGLASERPVAAERSAAVAPGTPALPPAPSGAPSVAMRATDAPAAAAATGGWMDTVMETAASVASLVTGETVTITRAVAPGTGDAPVATRPSGGAPVDLLAGDDLGVALAPTRAADGWQTAAAADDPAMLLLAELDAPTAPRGLPAAGLAADDGFDGPVVAGTVARPADPRLPTVDAIRAPAAARPVAAPTAAAPPPAVTSGPTVTLGTSDAPAADAGWSGGWLDTMTSAVATLVGAPAPVAPVVAPGTPLTPTVAVAPGTPAARPAAALSSEGTPGVDLLADDDGVGVLAVAVDRPRDAWQTAAGSDDPALQLLAELDGTPLPAGAARPAAAAGAPAAPLAEASGAADELFAGLAEDRAAAAPAVEEAGWIDTAASWMSAASALVSAPAAAPAAAAPVGAAPVGTASAPVGTASAPAAPRAARAPQPCTEGELCDTSLQSWRDPGGAYDLLAADDVIGVGGVREVAVAELFYVPGEDEELPDAEDLAALDSLRTIVVRVSTDTPGAPLEIDGKVVGEVPMVVEVTPGRHSVRVGGGNPVTLEAWNDPDEWCFEGSGRAQKAVRCL